MESKNILDSALLDHEPEQQQVVDLRKRALAFLLDYTLLIALICYTNQMVTHLFSFDPDYTNYAVITFYSVLFVLLEHRNNGSIFKNLLKITTVSSSHQKLGIHIYLIKMILRPITFIVAVIYVKLCMAIVLWLFGIYRPLLRFINGESFVLWYDSIIDQVTIKSSVSENTLL